MAKQIFNELITKGKVVRGYLGVAPQEITEDMREAMGLKESGGVLFRDVLDGTPAEKAGLKPGDVVLKFDGKKITSVEQFRRIAAETKPGTTVDMEIFRDGEIKTYKAKLIEFPEETAAVPAAKKEEKRWLGLVVRDLDREEKRESGIERGVVVDEVKDDSPAQEAGIQSGDVIIKINRETVNDEKDFDRIAKKLSKTKKPILFQLKREKSTYFITVRPD